MGFVFYGTNITKEKVFNKFSLYLHECEDRRRFGNKNEQVHFVLLSTCTIFA